MFSKLPDEGFSHSPVYQTGKYGICPLNDVGFEKYLAHDSFNYHYLSKADPKLIEEFLREQKEKEEREKGTANKQPNPPTGNPVQHDQTLPPQAQPIPPKSNTDQPIHTKNPHPTQPTHQEKEIPSKVQNPTPRGPQNNQRKHPQHPQHPQQHPQQQPQRYGGRVNNQTQKLANTMSTKMAMPTITNINEGNPRRNIIRPYK